MKLMMPVMVVGYGYLLWSLVSGRIHYSRGSGITGISGATRGGGVVDRREKPLLYWICWVATLVVVTIMVRSLAEVP